jgi:5,10-methylenetetrahydromethanopterin reductase
LDNIKLKLGIVLSTVTDSSLGEMIELGTMAEERGFHSVYVNEGRGDAIGCATAIGLNTKRIVVGTNIANIYFRHPFLTAQSARTASELTNGRFILGLGMSHRELLRGLGIEMGAARDCLANHVTTVLDTLAGKGDSGGPLRPQKSRHKIPVYVAGNTVESATIAGGISDGLMPYLTPHSHLPTLLKATDNALTERARPAGCIMSIPTFISDDEEAARSAARYNLAFFAQLPNYRRQWRRAGFKNVIDQIKNLYDEKANRRDVAAVVTDALIEDVCIFGPEEQCRDQIEQFRNAGAIEPVLAVSPVNEDRVTATKRAITLLGH